MKIVKIKLGTLSVPLKVPFKTSLRSVDAVNDIIVELHTDEGLIGYGEAPPTGVITGDTSDGIVGAIKDHISKVIIGRDIEDFENMMEDLQGCIVKNTSAKAAVDMALWDLFGKHLKVPVHKLLGNARDHIVTDITISVNDPDEMARDALDAVRRGYDTLKVKVGANPALDVKRLEEIRNAVGYGVALRIDANQAWKPKEAIRILNQMSEKGLDIEFVEQPVKAHDIQGLKMVTDAIDIPTLADEAVFSPRDAFEIIYQRAADMVNIKLMKCGGIYEALKIVAAAQVYEVDTMIGCMLEAKVSVNAAVSLACAKNIITKIDLDGPVLCKTDPVIGGATFKEKYITPSQAPGLGIEGVEGVRYFLEI